MKTKKTNKGILIILSALTLNITKAEVSKDDIKTLPIPVNFRNCINVYEGFENNVEELQSFTAETKEIMESAVDPLVQAMNLTEEQAKAMVAKGISNKQIIELAGSSKENFDRAQGLSEQALLRFNNASQANDQLGTFLEACRDMLAERSDQLQNIISKASGLEMEIYITNGIIAATDLNTLRWEHTCELDSELQEKLGDSPMEDNKYLSFNEGVIKESKRGLEITKKSFNDLTFMKSPEGIIKNVTNTITAKGGCSNGSYVTNAVAQLGSTIYSLTGKTQSFIRSARKVEEDHGKAGKAKKALQLMQGVQAAIALKTTAFVPQLRIMDYKLDALLLSPDPGSKGIYVGTKKTFNIMKIANAASVIAQIPTVLNALDKVKEAKKEAKEDLRESQLYMANYIAVTPAINENGDIITENVPGARNYRLVASTGSGITASNSSGAYNSFSNVKSQGGSSPFSIPSTSTTQSNAAYSKDENTPSPQSNNSLSITVFGY